MILDLIYRSAERFKWTPYSVWCIQFVINANFFESKEKRIIQNSCGFFKPFILIIFLFSLFAIWICICPLFDCKLKTSTVRQTTPKKEEEERTAFALHCQWREVLLWNWFTLKRSNNVFNTNALDFNDILHSEIELFIRIEWVWVSFNAFHFQNERR